LKSRKPACGVLTGKGLEGAVDMQSKETVMMEFVNGTQHFVLEFGAGW
jgi:hypothetical protein